MNSIPGYAAPLEPISAVDALAPAFRRTRSILAAPFRLGIFLKICFFVALAESGFLSAAISYPIQGANAFTHSKHAMLQPANSFLADGWSAAGALGAGLLLVLVAMTVVGVAVGCIAVYLLCRLRFTILDLAIYRQGSVRRAWNKYGRQTWRYFGMTILAGLLFLLMMAAVVGPFIPAFVRIGRTMSRSHPDPSVVFGLVLPLVGAILVLSFVGVLVDAVIRDFLLPSMAVEDASIESALRRFFGLLRNSVGSMALYLFMRTLVSMAMSAGLGIILVIPVAMVGLLAYAGGAVLYHSLSMGGAQILFFAYVVVAAAIVLLLYFLAMVTVFGVTGVFKLCYAVVFFGARYPALGDRLEAGPADQHDGGQLPLHPPPVPNVFSAVEPPPVW